MLLATNLDGAGRSEGGRTDPLIDMSGTQGRDYSARDCGTTVTCAAMTRLDGERIAVGPVRSSDYRPGYDPQ